MEAVKVLIYGDGEFELSPHGNQEPAAKILVSRLLGNPADVYIKCENFKRVDHARVKDLVRTVSQVKAVGYARKVVQAIELAKLRGFKAVVILADRDRRPDDELVVPLKDGRDSLAHQSNYPPCAVGVAVEAFDAWMIADGNAIGIAGGNASRSHPSPESLDGKEGTGRHPKDRAAEILGGQRTLGEKYAMVAQNLDIGLLRRCCLKGFAPFADEVEDRILPALSS